MQNSQECKILNIRIKNKNWFLFIVISRMKTIEKDILQNK